MNKKYHAPVDTPTHLLHIFDKGRNWEDAPSESACAVTRIYLYILFQDVVGGELEIDPTRTYTGVWAKGKVKLKRPYRWDKPI